MAITTSWTDPSEGGSLDLSTGGTITETWIEQSMSNLNYLGGTGGYGAYHKIAGTVLGAAAGSIDFTSIPAGYGALQLVVYARGNHASANKSLTAWFNGDTAANYDIQGLALAGTAGQDNLEVVGTTFAQIGNIPCAGAGAALFGMSKVLIPSYDQTNGNKILVSEASYKTAATSGSISHLLLTSYWRNTAAINRITITTTAGSIDQFSEVQLYGLPG